MPVLNGVDLVAYFSLDADAAPVYGTENYMAVFGNYRFYFSSMENFQKFEVWQEVFGTSLWNRPSTALCVEPVLVSWQNVCCASTTSIFRITVLCDRTVVNIIMHNNNCRTRSSR